MTKWGGREIQKKSVVAKKLPPGEFKAVTRYLTCQLCGGQALERCEGCRQPVCLGCQKVKTLPRWHNVRDHQQVQVRRNE